MSDCTYIMTSEDLEEFAAAIGICVKQYTVPKVDELKQALCKLGEILGKVFSEAATAIDDLFEAMAEAAVEITNKPKPKRPNYKTNPQYGYKMDYRSYIHKINYAYRKE